jgi:hypothetical protein
VQAGAYARLHRLQLSDDAEPVGVDAR